MGWNYRQIYWRCDFSFFGDPSSRGNEQDAVACVSMAMEMLEELNKLRISWRKRD